MTTKGLLIIAGIFVVAFLLLLIGRCGYHKLEEKREEMLTDPPAAAVKIHQP